MNIPNILTLSRLLIVPVIIWAISVDWIVLAFWIFILAGLSDCLDGFIAKQFNQVTELGVYLDPIADKALLVSIFIMLNITGLLPTWLVLAVVSRDLLIVGAIVLSWLMSHPMEMKPLLISKVNTLLQVVVAAVVLGEVALGIQLGIEVDILVVLTGISTVASAGVYLYGWLQHMVGDTNV